MKILLLILLPLTLSAQKKDNFWVKQGGIVAAGLIAGIADGQREVIVHNKWAYRYRHPNANENWWNPDSTWKRADKPPQMFVLVSDKYHLNQFIRNGMFAVQFGLSFTLYEKPNWKQIVLQAVIN